MSWNIQIHRAKPNPTGKDRSRNYPKHEQLLGEWVDLKNTGDAPVHLSLLHLCNATFLAGCVLHKTDVIYWHGSKVDVLAPSQIVRVHTGQSSYSSAMASLDWRGVNLHAYAEKSTFVLNNDCGDIISVWWKGNDEQWHKEDEALYARNVPDGAILIRDGKHLLPASVSV